MKPIPYGKHFVTKEDIAAVVETLQSDFLTQGPKIKEFEEAFAHYIGSEFAIAVSNGTGALHLCVIALGVAPGDRVITTPITFAATANCVRYCGGEVVFSDIDPDDYLLDLDKVEKLLRSSPKGYYKGIIVVDFAGKAVDLERLWRVAKEYDVWIIEDACHAPGGYFTDKSGTKQFCGNGKFSNLAIFSFHPVKHIASGEGGIITTNDEKLYRTLLTLRTHGITRDASFFQNSVSLAIGHDGEDGAFSTDGTYPPWYMEMQMLGFNYRLTDFQAALANSQLKRARHGLSRRRTIAKKYDFAFRPHQQIKVQFNELTNQESGHAYHLYVIQVKNRLGLYNHLRENNIYCQVHYIPLHLMPYYRNLGWYESQFPNSEDYYKSCLSIPIFPSLTDAEQDFVIAKIVEFAAK